MGSRHPAFFKAAGRESTLRWRKSCTAVRIIAGGAVIGAGDGNTRHGPLGASPALSLVCPPPAPQAPPLGAPARKPSQAYGMIVASMATTVDYDLGGTTLVT